MKVYIVNAFTEKKFGGNPAAVVPLAHWLPEKEMQAIAAQHNLPETAFIIPNGNSYGIRWFTPTLEVELCGHATLASAHVYFNHLGYEHEEISFHSKSGLLRVRKLKEGKITLDFPADLPVQIAPEPLIEQGLLSKPVAFFKSSTDYMVVLEKQADIENLEPDFLILAKLPARGLITTARGKHTDFVSRCFFPQSGIDEDPVTGSAHTVLTPYWASRLGRNKLSAAQLSKRGGWLECEWKEDRVLISGQAMTYLIGDLFL
jgi:PhzF family phenazine biosynthesis protein